MKRILFSAALACGFVQATNAQVVIDTVITGAGYANNIWYSLENDNQASQAATNWDIAVSPSVNPNSGLASAALFNYKSGTLYAVPGSLPANFATLDTTGMVASGPLFNSDTTWSLGAFNRTPNIGTYDYGWGSYDQVTHTGIAANRVFVIKFTNGTYKKLIIDLSFNTGYTIKIANLDNTALETVSIPLAAYTTKNFVYYSASTNTVIDREPASTTWDLTFLQYPHLALGGYPVAGILQNHNVEIAKVHPVNTTTYTDWSSQTFSDDINTIGYNWKASSQSGVTIEDSLLFFVKTQNGDLWKVIMTGFISGAGGGTGEYIFSKEKLETASVNELEADLFMQIFPNPANESVSLVVDNKAVSTVAVYNVLGALVYTTEVSTNGLQTVNVPVAGLNNGIYHVVYTSNGKAATQKLMVQH